MRPAQTPCPPLDWTLDWQQPWFQAFQTVGAPVLARIQQGATVAQALNEALQDAPIDLPAGFLRFVPQAQLPSSMAYEAFVHAHAAVPTRDNWHDFFHGLIWMRHPQLKARFNAWHVEAMAATSSAAASGRRGPLRDALTLFDENGLLLRAPEALAEALRQRDWLALGGRLRPLWREARWQIVGHALLEKLLQPRKPICAHVLLDESVLHAPWRFQDKPFAPLPVLGIPGWCEGNESLAFYGDVAVFRPLRTAQSG